jgi:DNA-binding transcriptional ArsR family regulator
VLNDPQRAELQHVLAAGSAPARHLAHARILLKADQSPDGPAWVDDAIAEALEISQSTVSRVRKKTTLSRG